MILPCILLCMPRLHTIFLGASDLTCMRAAESPPAVTKTPTPHICIMLTHSGGQSRDLCAQRVTNLISCIAKISGAPGMHRSAISVLLSLEFTIILTQSVRTHGSLACTPTCCVYYISYMYMVMTCTHAHVMAGQRRLHVGVMRDAHVLAFALQGSTQ